METGHGDTGVIVLSYLYGLQTLPVIIQVSVIDRCIIYHT